MTRPFSLIEYARQCGSHVSLSMGIVVSFPSHGLVYNYGATA